MRGYPKKVFECGVIVGAGMVACLLQGCVPGIDSTNHSSAYCGRIIDAERQQPIRHAKVELQGQDLTAFATTDKSGIYEVGPLHCRRICLYVAAPEGVWPQSCKHYLPSDLLLNLSVSCPGYAPTNVMVPVHGTNYPMGPTTLGDILLEPKHRTE